VVCGGDFGSEPVFVVGGDCGLVGGRSGELGDRLDQGLEIKPVSEICLSNKADQANLVKVPVLVRAGDRHHPGQPRVLVNLAHSLNLVLGDTAVNVDPQLRVHVLVEDLAVGELLVRDPTDDFVEVPAAGDGVVGFAELAAVVVLLLCDFLCEFVQIMHFFLGRDVFDV